MKKLVLAIVFALLFGFPFTAAAADETPEQTDPAAVYSEQYRASGADGLSDSMPQETRTVLRELHIDPSEPDSLAKLDAGNVFEQALAMIADRIKAPVRACAAVVGVLLLCAVVGALGGGQHGETLTGVYSYCAALAMGVLLLTPLMQSVLSAIESVRSCGIFMAAFVPVFAAVLISAGRAATAAGFQTLVFGAAQAVTQLASTVLAPLVGMYLAIGAAGSLSQGVRLDGISDGVKKAAAWTLGLCMTLFLGILSIQTVVASASDSVGLKTARFFVGSFVPVVGSSLSEALSTVQGCLGLLKSSLGIFAVLTAALILLPSVLEILLWKLTLLFSAAAADVFSLSKVSGSLRAINGALSMLLGIQLCCGALFIISTGVVVMAGGGG